MNRRRVCTVVKTKIQQRIVFLSEIFFLLYMVLDMAILYVQLSFSFSVKMV